MDKGPGECGAGWSYAATPEGALAVAGLWPDGYPSRVVEVMATDAIERARKRRASQITVVREMGEAEIAEAVGLWTATWAGTEHAGRMAASQMEWRRALARPHHDEEAVVSGLYAALDARGLVGWRVKRYAAARDARAAREAWAARDAREAWAARAAWAARDAWAARAARDAWAAWDARDALAIEYAALNGWTGTDPLLLTVGIRDAYAHGLGVAVSVAPKTLGWTMTLEAK